MLTLQGVNKLKQNPTELERIVKNHLVRGLVKADDLADDLVGPSVAGTKLRSNVYHSEDRDWRDVKVRRVMQCHNYSLKRRFVNTEKAPTRAWLLSHLRHY